jgi:acetylornithine/N-succinyldiaminopimelate aminotransferase
MDDYFESLKSKENNFFFRTYKRLNIHIEKGEGCYLITADGRRILDMFGGLAVNMLGYNHQAIKSAIENQINKYLHLSNYFYQDTQIRLAEKLITKTGFSKLFFTNSGTEAAEAALKIIRKYFHKTRKKEIIAFTGSFHGRTLGALSLTGRAEYRKDFEPLMSNVKFLRFNSTADLAKNINTKTSAVFLECMQGEGGINQVTPVFIKKLTELKNKYGFLLTADEIQSGLGRTGKFFAFEHYGLEPDLVLIAKGVGGGLPLGAVLGNETVSGVLDFGLHGSTFGGNPVACAAGLVVMNELEKGLMNNAIEMGKYLKEKLLVIKNNYPDKIKEVRGMGLMLGIELSFKGQPVVEKMLEEGVLVNCTNKKVIRLLPPLIITRDEADLFLNKFTNVIETLKI